MHTQQNWPINLIFHFNNFTEICIFIYTFLSNAFLTCTELCCFIMHLFCFFFCWFHFLHWYKVNLFIEFNDLVLLNLTSSLFFCYFRQSIISIDSNFKLLSNKYLLKLWRQMQQFMGMIVFDVPAPRIMIILKTASFEWT